MKQIMFRHFFRVNSFRAFGSGEIFDAESIRIRGVHTAAA
jgi:hypothetical protein